MNEDFPARLRGCGSRRMRHLQGPAPDTLTTSCAKKILDGCRMER